jgi:hypothetical protein
VSLSSKGTGFLNKLVIIVANLSMLKLRYWSSSQQKIVTLHDGVVGQNVTCHWQHTLRPLGFSCERNEMMRDQIVRELRGGTPLGAYNDPFQVWLMRRVDEESHQGYNNALRILSHFISIRGMPKTFGIHPPASWEL